MSKILLALSFLLSACTGLNEQRYTQRLDTWIGRDINELIEAWGEPAKVYSLPNGKKTYYKYKVSRSVAATSFFGATAITSTHEHGCTTSFIADESGKIIDWEYEGDRCGS